MAKSVFSEHLSELLKRSNMKIYTLARLSGVERTLIQKMLSGERPPADKEKVLRLARALELDETETNLLMRSRNITQMGPDLYSRHMSVYNFISTFIKMDRNTYVPVPRPNIDVDFAALPQCLEGAVAVNQVAKILLDHAAQTQRDNILLHAPAAYAFPTEYLVSIDIGHNAKTKVQHLIPMEVHGAQQDSCYNIDSLKTILPTILACRNYEPMGYYMEAHHDTARFSALPYFLLTDSGILAFSHDGDCGMFFHGAEAVAFYRKIFAGLKKEARPLLELLDAPEKQLRHYMSFEVSPAQPCIGLGFQPCFTNSLTEALYRKYIHPEFLRQIDAADGDFLNAYLNKCSQNYKAAKDVYTIFPAEGAAHFLQTGILCEAPPAYYRTIEPDDRRMLIETLLPEYEARISTPLLLRADSLVSPNLTITALNAASISVIYSHPQRGYIAFQILEKSVAGAIYDFLLALTESMYVASPENTAETLRGLLEKERG